MKRFATASFATGLVVGSLFFSVIVSAWTAPAGAPPTLNASAPVNLGIAAQTKNGTLGVNGLAVFGNTLLGGAVGSNAYLNFGVTVGSTGYGVRDNAGVVEFKNSGGSWQSLSTIVASTGTAKPVDIGIFGPATTTIVSLPFSSVQIVGGSWNPNNGQTGITTSGHVSIVNINGVWKYAGVYASGSGASTGTLVTNVQSCPLTGAGYPNVCLTRTNAGTLSITTTGGDAVGGPKFIYTVYGQ
jgi:hypothetical protein